MEISGKEIKQQYRCVALNSEAAAMSGDSCYPAGTCQATHLHDTYTLYDKVYSHEESILLRALSVMGSTMLEGDYITVIPNVKDKVALYRDKVDVRYQSAANGGGSANSCGPFTPKGSVVIQTNKFLHVQYMKVEVAICYKSLIGTFKQSMLMPGAMRSDENTALNDQVLNAIIDSNNKQTDDLIWKGDFKSSADRLCHFDGIIKKIVQANTGLAPQTIQQVFTGPIVDGDCIEGLFGGIVINVPWDTDKATTISNYVDEIAALTHPYTGEPLVTVSFNGTDTVTIVSNYLNNEVILEIAGTQCDGFGVCTVPTTPAGFTISQTTLIEYLAVDAPITTVYTPITSANVIDEISKLYQKASTENPNLVMEPDFFLHVSAHVWACYQLATVQLTGPTMGINRGPDAPTPMGLRMVRQPALPRDVMVGTLRSNIFFGTDLLSDLNNTEQWIDKKCQEVNMRHESFQGVQVDRFSETVSNLDCAPFTFQAAQPESGNPLDPCA